MRAVRAAALVVSVLLAGDEAAAQSIDFSAFHTPAQIDSEMTRLQTRFPALARVTTIGTSYEGRPIRALKISDNVATNEPAEGDVVLIGLHHAREWISTETVLYIAEQILQRYATDAPLQADVNNVQIWVIPVMNPDGYVWSASDSTHRDWRKNRRDNGDGTFGVDLNRNWGYQWGLLSGSSATTSDITYHGTGAFSEPETIVVRDFVNGLTNLKTAVSYHSYSELYLRPWSYTTADPPGETTLHSISARNIALQAAVHGHTYVDSIWYTASGDALDYLWGEKRVASFTPELRPITSDPSGFSPAPSEIIPTGEESYASARALIHDAGAREVWIRDYAGDSGVEPSAVATPSGWSHAFWESPDITSVPANPVEGTTATLSIHVNNNSGGALQNVTIEAYYNDPRITLEFPGLTSNLIGSTTTNVPPGGKTVTMQWSVPTGTNSWGEYHWCVGVVVKHDRDMPLTTQAERTSNIAIKNINTTKLLIGGMLLVSAENFLDTDAELRVVVDSASLPRGWRVRLPQPPRPDPRADRLPRPRTGIERKARLLGATGILLRPGETRLIPVRVDPPRGAPRDAAADVRIQGMLTPLVAGKRSVVGNGYTYHIVVGPETGPR